MNEYKGFKIGEMVKLPDNDYRVEEYLYNNIVEITGFNPKFDIVHWTARCIYGKSGMMISGSPYNEIDKITQAG